MAILKLTPKVYKEGLIFLTSKNKRLAKIVELYGAPPDWKRKEGFETLINIINEQMLSLKAAAAIFDRVKDLVVEFTPENFLAVPDEKLRTAGMSGRKILYCKIISDAVISGELDLVGLRKMDNDEAKEHLVNIKGIGEWTANIYLLMALKRADIWPVGDHALHLAVQEVNKLKDYPDKKSMNIIAEKYKPYRTIAARLYWNYYRFSRDM